MPAPKVKRELLRKTVVTSWEDLVKKLRFFEGRCAWACRGEPSTEYPSCKPTIDRVTTAHWKDRSLVHRLKIEHLCAERFRQQSQSFLTDPERDLLAQTISPYTGQLHFPVSLSSLTLMQHFGAPTRLMDWTASLWIAAFFACSTDLNKHGRILFFDKYRLTNNVDAQFHNQTDEDGMNPLDPERAQRYGRWLVVLNLSQMKFPRIIAQQGQFTLASKPFVDHWKLAKEMLSLDNPGEGASEIIIRKRAKPEVLQGLERMGITAAALFPGLDGLGRSIYTFAHFSHLDLGVKEILGIRWRKPVFPVKRRKKA